MSKNQFTKIRIRFFTPTNAASALRIVCAAKGCHWTQENAQRLAETYLAEVRKVSSTHNWKLVCVGPAKFNVVWDGRKDILATAKSEYENRIRF